MKKGLGRGLDALFADIDGDIPEEQIKTLRVSDIEPNRGQPRKEFDEEKLAELALSIKEHGVLQPLIVRRLDSGRYQIIAGERRWRASRMAGLAEVPVAVMELDDEKVMEIALIENLQREDLNPVEEAQGYRTLMEKYSLTQEEVARRVSKSRPVIANALRLLNLPEDVLEMVSEGRISSGHARALLSLEDRSRIVETASRIEKENLTVRDIEKLSKQNKGKGISGVQQTLNRELLAGMERELEEHLGRRVRIIASKSKGRVELDYYSEDDLEKLVAFLSSNNF